MVVHDFHIKCCTSKILFHPYPSTLIDGHRIPYVQVAVVRDEEVRISLAGQEFAPHQMFADVWSGMNLVRTTSGQASATVVNDRWLLVTS